ncbi:Mitochondrial protein cyt-4 [Tolypocladium capitatum]|uniref:Mitochondrial protein cyt-4 n=1 Tax=Tolypocladium capitatum TaxID=45235 RepID=A0A2K3Q8Q6_9HYPO|nr:Mitochondrial protein cyt-4 [Tolypocladium capitatum]
MLQYSSPPYVCRQCLARRFGNSRALPIRRSGGAKSTCSVSQRKWATTRHSPPAATLYGQSNIPKAPPNGHSLPGTGKPKRSLPIREQLRQWTMANDHQYSRAMPPDVFIHGSIANSLSRTQATGSSDLDHLRSADGGMTEGSGAEPASQDADAAGVSVDSRSPGDLVELRQTGSRVPVFGVYLGFFGDRNHFYAVNGKWITGVGFSPLFTVSNFASPSELEPVLVKIPHVATPEEFDDLRRNEKGPSREDGVGLIRKMTEFRTKSESVYQANLANLDGARTLLSNAHDVKYLSLFEIADILLPSTQKIDTRFPPHALYAVHAALYRDESGFSPLSPSSDCHRRDHLFEVFPQHHTNTTNRVAAMVREYTDASSKRSKPLRTDDLEDIALCKFILQAREAVSKSRLKREWTPHGILKASPGVEFQTTEWSQPSKDVIAFLEWWASYDLFDAGSRFHSYGALILRALNLYDDAPLDQSTAWSFLQEIGVVAPWEIPSRYRVRFPGVTIVRGGGLNRGAPQHLEKSQRPDIAAGARKQRAGSTVFCIDAPSTMVIDDGVSLESTDKADEFWIHIHAADPASAIKPDSDLRKFMELIPENIYLPGHFQAMLPSELGEEDSEDYKSESLVKQFSLRTGGPALTFSARVNEAGDVLDYKVEPSTLADVAYLDPDDVSKFCNEPPPPPFAGYSFSAGTAPKHGPLPPTRPMTEAKDLDEPSRNDLLTLYRLAEATKQRRLSNGAWPYFFPRPSVSVSFGKVAKVKESSEKTTILPADPYIKVAQEPSTGCSVVSNSMVLAGEIAARWCSSRGIPIPYRRDIRSAQNFDAAFAYATREIYPLIQQGIEPTVGQRQELSRFTGGIEISSQPGTYFLLGLDMYAKATSPLRRFSDLLVHWQIHAALAHERETRRRIDPAVDKLDDMLPFTAAGLRNTLPLLQMREKMARAVSGGTLDWILMALVRAWRFEGNAPRSLRFTVGSRWRQGLVGRLDLFGLAAVLDIAGLDGCRLVKDVQVGDEFEVELADVNVHSRQILVKATRYLGGKSQAAQRLHECPHQRRLTAQLTSHDGGCPGDRGLAESCNASPPLPRVLSGPHTSADLASL